MNTINAIAKVRFSSARPQRVQLGRNGSAATELLCMEAGQQIHVDSGRYTYYVITGSAAIEAGGTSHDLPMGQVAWTEADEAHTLTNTGEGRLLCLVIGG